MSSLKKIRSLTLNINNYQTYIDKRNLFIRLKDSMIIK